MTKAELEMLLFQNRIRSAGAKKCFAGDAVLAALEMQKMRILNAIYRV